MNNNRCLYCNRIIPEGRQVCPTCERELTVASVTPENELCRECKEKCKGNKCKRLKEYIKALKSGVGRTFTKINNF